MSRCSVYELILNYFLSLFFVCLFVSTLYPTFSTNAYAHTIAWWAKIASNISVSEVSSHCAQARLTWNRNLLDGPDSAVQFLLGPFTFWALLSNWPICLFSSSPPSWQVGFLTFSPASAAHSFFNCLEHLCQDHAPRPIFKGSASPSLDFLWASHLTPKLPPSTPRHDSVTPVLSRKNSLPLILPQQWLSILSPLTEVTSGISF